MQIDETFVLKIHVDKKYTPLSPNKQNTPTLSQNYENKQKNKVSKFYTPYLNEAMLLPDIINNIFHHHHVV